jgi:hypothetical protein
MTYPGLLSLRLLYPGWGSRFTPWETRGNLRAPPTRMMSRPYVSLITVCLQCLRCVSNSDHCMVASSSGRRTLLATVAAISGWASDYSAPLRDERQGRSRSCFADTFPCCGSHADLIHLSFMSTVCGRPPFWRETCILDLDGNGVVSPAALLKSEVRVWLCQRLTQAGGKRQAVRSLLRAERACVGGP